MMGPMSPNLEKHAILLEYNSVLNNVIVAGQWCHVHSYGNLIMLEQHSENL